MEARRPQALEAGLFLLVVAPPPAFFIRSLARAHGGTLFLTDDLFRTRAGHDDRPPGTSAEFAGCA